MPYRASTCARMREGSGCCSPGLAETLERAMMPEKQQSGGPKALSALRQGIQKQFLGLNQRAAHGLLSLAS